MPTLNVLLLVNKIWDKTWHWG